MQDLAERLRAHGMRMTPQRRRVLDAVSDLAHATPEEIVARVTREGGAPLPPSTVYRVLDALESLGVIDHTHLDHGAPSYHLADHADHIHLVCRGCGRVEQCPIGYAQGFVGNVQDASGFVAQVNHMAIHGWCARCAPGQEQRQR